VLEPDLIVVMILILSILFEIKDSFAVQIGCLCKDETVDSGQNGQNP
jgi:hypothetical protein